MLSGTSNFKGITGPMPSLLTDIAVIIIATEIAEIHPVNSVKIAWTKDYGQYNAMK